MRLFMFESETAKDLCAFAGDSSGSKLPTRFGPWQATGVINADRDPPHRLSRTAIETAITTEGFQLFRVKAAEPAPSGAARTARAKAPAAKPAATKAAAVKSTSSRKTAKA